MKIAIYGRAFSEDLLPYVEEVFEVIAQHNLVPIVYHQYHNFIQKKSAKKIDFETFSEHSDLVNKVDVLISLGGDGTLLDTLSLVRDSGIPIMGINFGRLGFLASNNKYEINKSITALINKDYNLDSRSLLSLSADVPLFGEENYALNDVTIHRNDNSSMMIIHTSMNGSFLNSYWGDGLIISTPTGSTAYSLSCGGPIIFPSAQNFAITPIAPHNLNVRPVIISDDCELTFEIETRSNKFLISCDSRNISVDKTVKINLKKADFSIKLIRLNNESYLNTLRNKLLWGIDTRNY
ncbi:MAG: NAD kinase [Sphingobacteriaceae bacterium]|nr:NAD kinase [Sphingobacteriaceae bacterium]